MEWKVKPRAGTKLNRYETSLTKIENMITGFEAILSRIEDRSSGTDNIYDMRKIQKETRNNEVELTKLNEDMGVGEEKKRKEVNEVGLRGNESGLRRLKEMKKRTPFCLMKCLRARMLHPAQCHALC